MRKHTTVDLDMDLVREAGQVLGTERTTDTIHAALGAVIRRDRRSALFSIPNDLDFTMLDDLRAHRLAERPAKYRSRRG
jgi:Arc/MetJ family transcription regulator